MERTCRTCGCTDVTPCVNDGVACHWVGPEKCSACPVLVTDAKIVDVSILADGKLETTIEGTLEDGRPFRGVWPGEWHVVQPTTTEEESP